MKIDSQFVTIKDDELLLFFDRNENYFLDIQDYSESLIEEFHARGKGGFEPSQKGIILDSISISDQQNILKAFLEKRNSGRDLKTMIGITFFKKPADCGNDACMVLCDNFKAFIPIDSRIFLSENFNYITSEYMQRSASDMKVISCDKPKKIKVFPNINTFYRKIYSLESRYEDKPTGSIEVADNKFNYPSGEFLYNGSFLFSHSSQLIIMDEKSIILTKDEIKGGSTYQTHLANAGFNANLRPVVWELVDNTNSKFVALLPSSYVYFQKYGSDSIVMCYSPPCVSMQDELYNKLDSQLRSCLESSDACSPLSGTLLNYANDNQLTLKKETNSLRLLFGKNDFSFNKAVEFWIIPDASDDESFYAPEVSLVYDTSAATSRIRLDARLDTGTVSYSLISISSEMGLYPRLDFIVTPYNPPS
jgi:hypothetical protein